MSFGTLALVVLAGMAGPLLAATRRGFVPVIVGEILAGLVIGRSGLRLVDPGNPTLAFLAQIGFAMLMLSAGMRVPLRQRALRRALLPGAVAAGVAALVAVPGAVAVRALSGGGPTGVYWLLLATGSSAIVLPTLQELGLHGRFALVVVAQVAVADVATIFAVPAIIDPSRAGKVTAGGVLVVCSAVAAFVVARRLGRWSFVSLLRERSKERGWALDLRTALVLLFGLAWIAERSGTSVLVAGFSAGLMVAAIGGPQRLSGQVLGIAQGFFVPLFFVTLGAGLDVRALGAHPSFVILMATLAALNVAVHCGAAVATGQPLASGLVATAQLGVPAAVVALGVPKHVISAGQGAAIIAAALASLAISTAGAALLTRRPREHTAPHQFRL